MIRKVGEHPKPEMLTSYQGLLWHGNTYALQELMLKRYSNEYRSDGDRIIFSDSTNNVTAAS
ncbi:MAG: hypothetical protein A3J67_04310 [Parcubacteria group bacterium RIFCSPHIGHO2_02_FULL_48_10b]|nr:MAG: hypothetical protein A3J67_04310 [Parcubacteria group bacterium RIFCSPHIGHO2_02_FULL_48_10b]